MYLQNRWGILKSSGVFSKIQWGIFKKQRGVLKKYNGVFYKIQERISPKNTHPGDGCTRVFYPPGWGGYFFDRICYQWGGVEWGTRVR